MKRVYLNTPEEVIKALKDGKVIKNRFGHKYKFLEGLIVCDNRYINNPIDCFDYNELLVEDEDPLKIEVGKWYETRDHQKVRCYFKGEEVAFFTIDNDINPLGVYINGHFTNSDAEHPLDIIGLWKD